MKGSGRRLRYVAALRQSIRQSGRERGAGASSTEGWGGGAGEGTRIAAIQGANNEERTLRPSSLALSSCCPLSLSRLLQSHVIMAGGAPEKAAEQGGKERDRRQRDRFPTCAPRPFPFSLSLSPRPALSLPTKSNGIILRGVCFFSLHLFISLARSALRF
jgi:hypothetical protein